MCKIYTCITHVVLYVYYISRIVTCITCVKHVYYRCLHMYYRCMNYMCNIPKTPHMHYMCSTHVIHMWHIWLWYKGIKYLTRAYNLAPIMLTLSLLVLHLSYKVPTICRSNCFGKTFGPYYFCI